MKIADIAALIMPPEQRQDMREEWRAEIAFITENPDATRWNRSWQASRYAVSLLRSAANIRCATRKLTALRKAAGRRHVMEQAEQLILLWRLHRYLKKASPQEVLAVLLLLVLAAAWPRDGRPGTGTARAA